ncbi:peroxiredoxin family protein [Solilutibacter silvestris]|uniref:AhpC/TSA family protein n=1 Tax=Solilutibacter silvestris TaxID=1645665 RepID=A0A2K1Q3F1_9GAMM|nr:TlpA disulfide reductase family protein [Lysobacter silvestris]PNS09575.1 AhpC/TSA family protein [Lysobacter silvestris]
MTRFLRYIVSAALLGAATLAAARGNELAVGQAAPRLTMTTLDGAHFDTRELKGKVVFLTFWATWCGPCRAELPALSRYASAHASQGVVVLALSLDSPADLQQVREIARDLSFPVGMLGDEHVPGYGRIWHLPVSFVIDRQGRLVVDGWKDKDPVWNATRLEREVTPLL